MGTPHFDGQYAGIRYRRLPTVRYRARCLRTLQLAYAGLDPAVRACVDARLAAHAIVIHLQQAGSAAAFEPIAEAEGKAAARLKQIGRATGRERVGRYV